MGMADSFFAPQPCNFGKLHIFLRCSNDISTIFWHSSWGQTCQKCQKPMCPSTTEVNSLWNHVLRSLMYDMFFNCTANACESYIIIKRATQLLLETKWKVSIRLQVKANLDTISWSSRRSRTHALGLVINYVGRGNIWEFRCINETKD